MLHAIQDKKEEINKYFFRLLLVNSILLILTSCAVETKPDFLTILVNSEKETPLALSEISENIEAIELETTDESLIGRVSQVCYDGEYIIVPTSKKILLFNKTGKFIRNIGSQGQGPGEFNRFWNITTGDNKIYINDLNKIICYDFNGNFIKEASPGSNRGINYLNYANDRLLLHSETTITDNERKIRRITLYSIDNKLSRTDSIIICETDIVDNMVYSHGYKDFITIDNDRTFLYYSDISSNTSISDTLYQLKNKQLIPHLHLTFKNKGLSLSGEKNILIYNIYRSSRYIFSIYYNNSTNKLYSFCYDTKSESGYNMKEGYTDDIHTGEIVKIRPFCSDANKFYYLHTHIDDDTKEEPNPTLYIGTLKK